MAVTLDDSEHGTYGGYQLHGRRRRAGLEEGEPCAACRKAHADYVASWRARNPGKHQRQQTVQYCREKALRRLAEMHPRAFARLYREERAKLRSTVEVA